MPERRIIAGLDIGTSKVCAILAEEGPNQEINIVGVGTSPSHGLKKGMVVNLDKTVQAITLAMNKAERMAGTRVTSVFVGVAGGHISSFNSHGVVAVASSDEITDRDVKRVIEAAKVVAIPNDRQMIHVLPREFMVDSCRGIKDPEGMAGKRLEVNVHIVTGAVTALQNVVKCVERAGYDVEDLILQPIASSASVLTCDEQESGTILIDIGGGTTDLAVFYEGAIFHTCVIPIGGDHFSQDLAFGLRIPFAEAERLKINYSQDAQSQVAATVEWDEPLRFGVRETRDWSKVVSIVEPRAEELFSLIKQELNKMGDYNIAPIQVVLTGGSSLLWGMEAMAERVLQLPIRIGSPESIGGLTDIVQSPIYATGIGLVQYACKNNLAAGELLPGSTGVWAEVVERIKRWFKDFIPMD